MCPVRGEIGEGELSWGSSKKASAAAFSGSWTPFNSCVLRPSLYLFLRARARRAAGTSWPDLGVRAQLLRSARALQGARRKGRAQVDGKWRDGWEPICHAAPPSPTGGGAPLGASMLRLNAAVVSNAAPTGTVARFPRRRPHVTQLSGILSRTRFYAIDVHRACKVRLSIL